MKSVAWTLRGFRGRLIFGVVALCLATAGCFGHRNVLPLVAESGDNAWGENLTRRWFFEPLPAVLKYCAAAAQAQKASLAQAENSAAPAEKKAGVVAPPEPAAAKSKDAAAAEQPPARDIPESKADEERILTLSDGRRARLLLYALGPRCTKAALWWENVPGRSDRNTLSEEFFDEAARQASAAPTAPPAATQP